MSDSPTGALFSKVKARLDRFLGGDWAGLHFSANIFVATTVLWIIVRKFAGLNPIWAISSMIAASDPVVKTARKTFHGRMVNSLIGCAVGMLVIGGSNEWKLPIALAAAAFISAYVVRVQVIRLIAHLPFYRRNAARAELHSGELALLFQTGSDDNGGGDRRLAEHNSQVVFRSRRRRHMQ